MAGKDALVQALYVGEDYISTAYTRACVSGDLSAPKHYKQLVAQSGVDIHHVRRRENCGQAHQAWSWCELSENPESNEFRYVSQHLKLFNCDSDTLSNVMTCTLQLLGYISYNS